MTKLNKSRKFIATSATAALVASAIVPVASAAQINDFNSVSSYAQEAVQDLNDRGVIKGDQKGNFNPTKPVTRAEAATILTSALELEATGSINFADVKSGAWYYDAIKAAVSNGIFQGQGAGKFNPSGNLTRSEAAIILVDAFGLEGTGDLSEFKDAGSVKSWATEALEIAVANGVMKGDNGNLNPNKSISRQEFAVMYSRTEAIETSEVSGSVKAINTTTVEVTFEEPVTDLNALNFAIEGLTISNKAVKQTNAKTVVLTTSAQTADVEYTVTLNGEAIGKFKGASAVVPTKIDVTTSSLQGVIGKEVTLKAQVTVAEGQSKAGIPVTFNIVSDNTNINSKIEVEALTDDKGVASYSYTRYYSHNDNVAAYATSKSSVVSNGKVYWANDIQLAVSELTAGNELSNETKKSYKVTGDANTTYYIAIKENLGVTPDKITQVKVQNYNTTVETTDDIKTPYTLSTSGQYEVAAVRTNSSGEGSFTIYGTNLSATPIVYSPESTPTTPQTTTYTKLDLQAEAPTVKFSQVDKLALTVVGEGSLNSAESAANLVAGNVAYNANSVGGRTYTATVKDKDGKLAPEGTVAYVTFEKGNISEVANTVFFSTGTADFTPVTVNTVKRVIVGKEGKAQFRVAGTGATTFVKPTVFLNTAGDTAQPVLDKTGSTTDIFAVAEVTYFKSASVTNALLTVKDEHNRTVTSLSAGKDAYFTYQSVDQNGFAYRPTGFSTEPTTQLVWKPVFNADGSIKHYIQETVTVTPGSTVHEYTLSFDVTSTFGNATVKNAAGDVLNANQNHGNTQTYQIKSDAEGKAIVRVTSTGSDTVTVNVTGANTILPTKSATVSFVNSTIVPELYSGTVESYNSTKGTLKFAGKQDVALTGSNVVYTMGTQVIANYEAFVALLANATGTVSVTRSVKDGVTTFNIYSISTTGAKPVDTAATPTVSYTAINGTVGTAIIAATPTVTGLPSGATLTYSTATNTLPAGLSINSATGVISGTPTATVAASTVTVTATYTNTVGLPVSVNGTVAITVVAAPTTVSLAAGSAGTAGNTKVTGLTAGTKYVVTEGTNFYGVKADGTLATVKTTKAAAEAEAVALTGTEITGLNNGTTYKVEVTP